MDGYTVNIGCLLFSKSMRRHWGTANNFCQFEAGGTLAEVSTEMQFDFVRTQLALQEVDGSNVWWTSGTDVGVDGVWNILYSTNIYSDNRHIMIHTGVWKWATSYSAVGDFIWTEGSPPTAHRTQNCLALSLFHDNHTIDFMGVNTHCDTTGAFPICQIKPL